MNEPERVWSTSMQQFMQVTGSHHDVNGKWGGFDGWCVDVTSPNGERDIYLYRLIGKYWDVGHKPDHPGTESRWSAINRVLEAMDSGVSPDLIVAAIEILKAAMPK